MLLSILIPGKNDNFRSNTSKVLELNLEQTLKNIELIGNDDVEVVLCDWGSETKIVESLFTKKHNNFKCVYVSPEITKKYNNGSSYSIVHPLNTSFRYSQGKYVMFWDSDCFVTPDNFEKLYNFVRNMNETDDMSFYWGSRSNVPYDTYIDMKSCDELTAYLSLNPKLWTELVEENGRFRGCGVSMLMDRSLWEESTGWYEKLTHWGWQDIEFHNRLLSRYNYGGDLLNHGISFHHMLHDMENINNTPRLQNQQINSPKFDANDVNWGLKNEKLEII